MSLNSKIDLTNKKVYHDFMLSYQALQNFNDIYKRQEDTLEHIEYLQLLLDNYHKEFDKVFPTAKHYPITKITTIFFFPEIMQWTQRNLLLHIKFLKENCKEKLKELRKYQINKNYETLFSEYFQILNEHWIIGLDPQMTYYIEGTIMNISSAQGEHSKKQLLINSIQLLVNTLENPNTLTQEFQKFPYVTYIKGIWDLPMDKSVESIYHLKQLLREQSFEIESLKEINKKLEEENSTLRENIENAFKYKQYYQTKQFQMKETNENHSEENENDWKKERNELLEKISQLETQLHKQSIEYQQTVERNEREINILKYQIEITQQKLNEKSNEIEILKSSNQDESTQSNKSVNGDEKTQLMNTLKTQIKSIESSIDEITN